MMFNDTIDALLCGVFLVVTWAVVISSVKTWMTGDARSEQREAMVAG
jgi:hypothetical protein